MAFNYRIDATENKKHQRVRTFIYFVLILIFTALTVSFSHVLGALLGLDTTVPIRSAGFSVTQMLTFFGLLASFMLVVLLIVLFVAKKLFQRFKV
ncbi:hypothetical protein [Alteromonas gilva]|uniref:Uncharacterized protein n=1 Tax=Alteromonas gilva TaxID=2987522 RepID=A0ABT5L4T0_9ALTE|nr:hypothetical protein [Alteromonas gilva]MDC8831396.1 hypothetical protein [Alteromonas gilva]